MKELLKINKVENIDNEEKNTPELEQNPDLANAAYETLGFKGKDFVYTSELIDEVIEKPDFEELLPVAQIFKHKDRINHTKVFLGKNVRSVNFLNQNTIALGQTTNFIENNKIANNIFVFDKKYYEALGKPERESQQSTLLHEEIHRYTSFIIGEYKKIAKFPGIEYCEKFKEHFNSLGIHDVSLEIEFLKEYFNLFEIYKNQGGWLNSIEFITYGLTNKGGVDFLKNIRLHGRELSKRSQDSLNNLTLYDALLDLFKYYYTNLSDDVYASSTDTVKLKFDSVLVSTEQKNKAEQIYLEYIKTLASKNDITKEGFIDFIKTKELGSHI
ncbi:TPA: hypothetical protein DIC38_00395 [Candidatus Nomurabacteria bacterium]|nr:MAG: hypothetical protein O210_OD1C00001G0653 [Parcubacteria bacterium RAAC4_OD1_1]HCY26132.1 hypothetical protein [Candidatus Nomurabacteria bacterium]